MDHYETYDTAFPFLKIQCFLFFAFMQEVKIYLQVSLPTTIKQYKVGGRWSDIFDVRGNDFNEKNHIRQQSSNFH